MNTVLTHLTNTELFSLDNSSPNLFHNVSCRRVHMRGKSAVHTQLHVYSCNFCVVSQYHNMWLKIRDSIRVDILTGF